MNKPTPMFNCDLCGSCIQMGAGRYEGKTLPHYQLTLCKPCFGGNWDGFAPHYEPQFEKLLAERNIPLPKRNSKGWYPR